MSRRLYTSPYDGKAPDVTAWAPDGDRHDVAIYHRVRQGETSTSITSYLSRDAARELARNLLAACDAIDVDEARQRNLALPGTEAAS